MFRKIAGTTASRVINALLSLGTVVVATRFLGAEGYGTITLVLLGIAFIQLTSNILGGPALVYLVPRQNIFRLLTISYIFVLLISVAGANLLWLFDMIPAEYKHDTILLSILSGWSSANLMILLGREKIMTFNLLSMLQFVLILLALSVFFLIAGQHHPDYYIAGLYISHSVVLLAGLFILRKEFKHSNVTGITETLRLMVRYGGLMQLSSILQFFNYRLSYYLLEHFHSRAMLGTYAVGVQLAEGMWLVAKSVALVQYSRISNEPGNIPYATALTVTFLKFTVLVTTIMILLLLLVPASLFTTIFSEGFANIKTVILALSPGIIFMAVNQILGHFFSGIGKPALNTISSTLGLFVVVAIGLWLIPEYGLVGGALASSASYMAITFFLAYRFWRITRISFKELIISKKDISLFRSNLKQVFDQRGETMKNYE